MRHPLCVLCEDLDQCRFMDCQEVIPEGQALYWHCTAALADDFAPESPEDVFFRTPEPWGRPGETRRGNIGRPAWPRKLVSRA